MLKKQKTIKFKSGASEEMILVYYFMGERLTYLPEKAMVGIRALEAVDLDTYVCGKDRIPIISQNKAFFFCCFNNWC